uniref:Predicted protein n=1 Tax=Hordeum vulgare subsp. vulgare TaxID=112509 RepID=F2EJP8_HORVV|nr:predicted protein [Hordeum vulgare subsp. vulgare]
MHPWTARVGAGQVGDGGRRSMWLRRREEGGRAVVASWDWEAAARDGSGSTKTAADRPWKPTPSPLGAPLRAAAFFSSSERRLLSLSVPSPELKRPYTRAAASR